MMTMITNIIKARLSFIETIFQFLILLNPSTISSLWNNTDEIWEIYSIPPNHCTKDVS